MEMAAFCCRLGAVAGKLHPRDRRAGPVGGRAHDGAQETLRGAQMRVEIPRRALWFAFNFAFNQEDFPKAVVGDLAYYKTCSKSCEGCSI